MNHDDPLCTTVLNTEMSDAFCNCDVVARVREDEAELHGYRLHDPAYANGYAAALRDAIEAVKALPVAYDERQNDMEVVSLSEAVAAIEALGKPYDGQWHRDLYGGAS